MTTTQAQQQQEPLVSSKTVYTAVPLVPPTEIDEAGLIRAHRRRAAADNQKPTHFVAGACMGMVCYYIIHMAILPALPHMENILADSIASALVWSAITTIAAYTLWFTFIHFQKVVASCTGGNNNNDDAEESSFWETMEFYYAVGVFLGFSTACVVSLTLAGVPSVFIVAIVVSAVVWTKIMAYLASQDRVRAQGTILPTVLV